MNVYKKSIVLIIFYSFTFSCKLSKNTETEPNNTFSNANVIEINKEIMGHLESENDIDNYILNINEDQILKIELSGIKGINHSINIYKNENPKPQLIKVIDDNRKSAPETFANLFVQSGQYFFAITHGGRDIKKGNTETPYKLKITTRSFLNEEKEPDDTPYTATLISDKSLTSGYFSPAQNSLNNDTENKMKETDWYRFDIAIADKTPVLIDIKLTGVNGVDSVITVLNGAMEEIQEADNGSTGEGEVITDFGIKESGVYYVQVSSKNFLFNHDIPYELKLDYKTYDLNSELESNNNFENANVIANNLINGNINSLDDRDFYQFVPSFKNKYYKIGCTGSEGLDLIITIYDNNRNKLFEINNTGPGEAEKLPYFLIKNPIYISISASKLTSAASKYTLYLEQFESDEIIEIEPNNSKTTANPINKKVTGFINNKKDIDYYLIKSEERQKLKIHIKGVKDGKIRISTTDQLGFIIKSKDIESDEEITFPEIFDKKGFLIIEPVVPNFEFPYTITIEDQ